jgi:uncharacterized protein
MREGAKLKAAGSRLVRQHDIEPVRRAKAILGRMNLIAPGGEAVAVSQLLNADAWTYVAAFITSLLYFLWHVLPLISGRDRD